MGLKIFKVGAFTLGPVLFSDWPAHFRDPLLDPKGFKNAKKRDMLMRKNGAPPNFVLYTSLVTHYECPALDYRGINWNALMWDIHITRP